MLFMPTMLFLSFRLYYYKILLYREYFDAAKPLRQAT